MAGNNIHSQLTTQDEIHVPKGFTEAANHTGLIKNTLGQLQWVDLDSLTDKSNMTAVVDPTANDDANADYVVGSRWVNTVQNNIFFCTDNTVGAAIWAPVTRVNVASNRAPTPTDDASQGYKEGSCWVQISTPTNIAFICASSAISNAQWAAVNAPIVVGIDHRTLSHVTAPADDHTQYVHIDGRRAMTGDFSMGGNQITGVTNVIGEQRLFTTNLVKVKKNPGLGEFSSLAAAIASVTTAGPSNPFLIQVGPGVFSEPQITMKPYVYVDGLDFESTIVEPQDPTNHLIIACENSAISRLMLTGVTGAGKALIYFANTLTDVTNAFWVENIRFGQADTLAIADGLNGNSQIYVTNSRYGGSYQFNTGFVARTTSSTIGKITVRNCTSSKMTAPFPQDMFLCDGLNCEMNLKSVNARTGTTGGGGNGLRITNGGTARIASLDIEGFSRGLWLENVGPAPTLIGGLITFLNNTSDVQVDHPGSMGGLACGANDDTKVSINPAATAFGYLVLGLEDGDILISGKLKQNQPDGTFTDTTTLSTNASPVGLLTSGDINIPASGLTTSIEAGFGYVKKSDDSLIKIIWPLTNFTATPNSTLFVYFDEFGVVNLNATMPDPIQNIVIGRVVTDSSGFIAIEESGFKAVQAASNIGQALRGGLGAVYSSGSVISELGTRTLSITAGSYYLGERNFLTAGGSPVTFASFYQNGTGGYVDVLGQTVVDNANWDNGTGTLAPIGAGNYVKHALYVLGDSTGDFDSENYFLVYSQTQFTALTLAEQGSLPNPPSFMTDAITLIGSIIVQQGATNIVEIRDERPLFSSRRTSSVAATSFHHNLLGLNDFDDHSRYLPVDGSRPMTGNLPMGTHSVTGAGTYNGVTVENHHARHQPGSGLDELVTAAPATISPDQLNGVGVSTSLARADHIHNVPTATAVGINAGTTSSAGASTSFSRADHTHAIASGVPSSQTPDQANATGVSSNFARADHVHNIPTIAPITQTPDNINADGSAASFSRSDHTHNIPTAIASGLSANTTNTQGAASSFARSDHTHAISTTSPVTLIPDQANSAGTSASLPRADHVHNVPTAAATTLSFNTTNTQGVATSFARSDHTHAITSASAATASTIMSRDASANTAVNVLTATQVNALVNAGGYQQSVITKTANYTALTTDGLILADATTGPVTITLPAASNKNRFTIVKIDSSANAVTVSRSGSDTIAGATTYSLPTQYAFLRAEGDGTTTYYNTGTGFATPVTQTPDQANTAGTSLAAARADHIHNIPTAAPANQTVAASASDGSAATFSRADHLHTFSTAAAITQNPDQANATGTSTSFARADHVHNVPTAAATSLTTASTNTQGVSTSFARADHTHTVTVSNQQVTASSAAALTTTALTDTLIAGMTLTPSAGTYLVLFTSSCVNSANSAQRTFVSAYFNGTQVTNSEIAIGEAGGAYIPVTVQGVVAANGVNAIEIRARVAAGTTTWWAMTMQLIRLSN